MVTTDATFTEALTPYLPLLGVIAGSLLVGAFAVWNRRRGATETRAPDVNEIWLREERQSVMLERERRYRRALEAFVFLVHHSFRTYARRVQSGGTTEFTPIERTAHDSEPPAAPDAEP